MRYKVYAQTEKENRDLILRYLGEYEGDLDHNWDDFAAIYEDQCGRHERLVAQDTDAEDVKEGMK